MTQDNMQEFRVDIFKLLRDELSVAVNPLDLDGAPPYASTFPGEVLTRILEEKFGFDDRSLCELGMELAAQGRATVTLRCTQNDLRDARFLALPQSECLGPDAEPVR